MNEDWQEYVEGISTGQLRAYLWRSLGELGVTYAQLEGQARRGRFQSERARLVWMGIAGLGHLAEDP